MTSTPRWLEDEDRLLHKAVACYGHQWAVMKTLGILPGRSSSALRFQWLSISNTERSFVIPTPPCDNILPRMSSSSAPWRSYQHREVRDKTGGRPWDYYVSRTRVREREPSSRQWQLLKLWCLDNPNERLLLCNLGRAEGTRYIGVLSVSLITRNLERCDPFFSAYPQQTQKVGLVMCCSQLPGRCLSVTHVELGKMIVIKIIRVLSFSLITPYIYMVHL